VFDWCRANRVDWLFGLAPNVALRRHVTALEKSTAERFKEPAPAKAGVAPNRGKVRRFMQFYDAAEEMLCVERRHADDLGARLSTDVARGTFIAIAAPFR